MRKKGKKKAGDDQKQKNKGRKKKKEMEKRFPNNLLLTKPQEWKRFLVQSSERERESLKNRSWETEEETESQF